MNSNNANAAASTLISHDFHYDSYDELYDFVNEQFNLQKHDEHHLDA